MAKTVMGTGALSGHAPAKTGRKPGNRAAKPDLRPEAARVSSGHPPGAAPGAPRWRRRAADRPAEILEAALTVFAARGFAATKLEDVAAAAGVSKGTLYLYFTSKTALFEAMALELLRGPVLARADLALQAPSAAEALRAIVQSIGEMLSDRRRSALPKLIIAESGSFPELARFWLKNVIDPMRERLAGLVARGIEAGEFQPVDPWETAKQIIAPYLVAAIWRQTFEALDHRRSDPAVLMRQHIHFLLAGLTTPSLAAMPPTVARPSKRRAK